MAQSARVRKDTNSEALGSTPRFMTWITGMTVTLGA